MTTTIRPFYSSLPEISISHQLDNSDEVLVIGLLYGEETPSLVIGEGLLDDREADQLDAALAAIGATGESGEIWRIPAPAGLSVTSVLAIGLGEGAKAESSESIRKAAGIAAKHLEGVTRAATTFGEVDLAAAAEGFLLGAYSYNLYLSETKKIQKAPVKHITFLISQSTEGNANTILDHARTVASAVAIARDFTNTPSNHLYPEIFALQAKKLAEKHNLTVEILDEKELATQGYGGIIGIGQGSAHLPRLVRIYYDAKSEKTVALVGKGITFDTGGISIKPAKNMENMTSDMAGAAAVLASIIAAATLELPINVIATIPLAENMPSSTAIKPGDVITHLNGTTSEVVNTDAEGRIILADALVRASQDNPDYLIETSTLTGAQVVALGSRIFGILGKEEFRDRVTKIAQESGENSWPMPLPEEILSDLNSHVADIANISDAGEAGMLVAGVYLQQFVPTTLPWVHLDIAGPAFNSKAPWGYTPKGATGVPVRSIIAVLEDIAAHG